MKVALIGNPNCGKTTLFNRLTGSNAKVGNWAGVTVEKKTGYTTYNNTQIEIVDLPGIYSLNSFSEEERVTLDFLKSNDFDLIINILDVTNIERNLYLTTQLFELGVNMIVALNMIDYLESHGGLINEVELKKRLSVPCVKISASKNIGIDILIEKSYSLLQSSPKPPFSVLKDYPIYDLIEDIKSRLDFYNVENSLFNAIKLVENDNEEIRKQIDFTDVLSIYSNQFDMIVADNRYNYIEKTLKKIYISINQDIEETISDKIDKVLLNRTFGIPIFFGIMFIIFTLTFGTIGKFMQNQMFFMVDKVIPYYIRMLFSFLDINIFIKSLVLEGIFPGVGMILTFLPQIMLIFLFIAILEDVGYMSRATYLMDNLLRKIGLSGKAFIPMVMGFGCSVPALMATKTLENKKDRRLAIILTPFISCGARLPIYLIFTGVFFQNISIFVIFSIYILGIFTVMLSGFILNKLVFKNENTSYIMELSPYKLPVAKSLFLNLVDKAQGFLEKVTTILLCSSIIIWFLQNFDFSLHVVDDNYYSIFGSIGRFIAPIFIPLGFGTWEASVSLLTGFLTKEAVVSTLSILFEKGNTSIANEFTPLTAISYMIFTSLYIPCISTLATMKKELNSTKWFIFAITFQMIVAYSITLLFYGVANVYF